MTDLDALVEPLWEENRELRAVLARLLRAVEAGADTDERNVIEYEEHEYDELMEAEKQARAALAPSETGSVDHWQPIDTAPKGRKVIVHYLNPLGNARVVMARYYPQHTLEMDDDPGETGDYDEASGVIYAPEGWYEEHDSDEPILPLGGVPSHWTAVPAPPGAESPASESRPVCRRISDEPCGCDENWKE